MRVYVNVKKPSSRKNTIAQVPYELTLPINTVKDLIEQVVGICVGEYNARMESKELLHALSMTEMEDMASEGKIAFGVNYGTGMAHEEEAVKNALQCFEDGIFRIFIGQEACKSLEETVNLCEDCELTFVRLTMLTGRMW